MWRSALGCIITFILSLLAAPLAAEAQPGGKTPRLGILTPGIPPQPWVEAFRQELHALGYAEGQTVALEVRWDGRQRTSRNYSSRPRDVAHLSPSSPAPAAGGRWRDAANAMCATVRGGAKAGQATYGLDRLRDEPLATHQ